MARVGRARKTRSRSLYRRYDGLTTGNGLGDSPERDSGFSLQRGLGFENSILQQITTDPVIAVIEDDESVAISLARFLRASGFQSSIYRSATAFLDDPEHHRFDCLIVDLQLDGMSGIELSRHLASVGDRAPVILMTALDEQELDKTFLQKDNVVFMRKSEPGEALLATLNRMLHQCRHPVNGPRDGTNA